MFSCYEMKLKYHRKIKLRKISFICYSQRITKTITKSYLLSLLMFLYKIIEEKSHLTSEKKAILSCVRRL